MSFTLVFSSGVKSVTSCSQSYFRKIRMQCLPEAPSISD